MIGLGIDVCQVSRIERAQTLTGRFLEAYFTEEERAYIRERGAAGMQSAAACFAAKEALLKALGLGICRGVKLADIGVSHNPAGAPIYDLRETALAALRARGGSRALLSLTHEAGFAVAVCVVE